MPVTQRNTNIVGLRMAGCLHEHSDHCGGAPMMLYVFEILDQALHSDKSDAL